MNKLVSATDYNRLDYWHQPAIQAAILQALGSQAMSFTDLKDSEISSAYLTAANPYKASDPRKTSPAHIVSPERLVPLIDDYGGNLELHASIWQKESLERKGFPRRSMFILDIESYDNQNPLYTVLNSEENFNSIEPTYNLITSVLKKYGISFQAVVSGRGYNFLTQIPDTSGVMDDLIDISGVLESTVLGRQAYPNSLMKRNEPVPEISERLHVAMARLQQYLFNLVIRRAREVQKSPVEVSDMGERGLAFDNTSMLFPIENRTIATLGSPYFIKPWKIDPYFSETLVKIPRETTGLLLPLDEVLESRASHRIASELLGSVDCTVPDGSKGLKKLIKDYKKSDLFRLHTIMDESFGDDPKEFDGGYRRYEDIAAQTSNPERIGYLMSNANDELLKPDNLNYLIWEIFTSWGGDKDNLEAATHVAGLLRAIYEDPKFQWGPRFLKRSDALRFARGWVITILGQAFEAE